MTAVLPSFSLQRAENLLPEKKWKELISTLVADLDGFLHCTDDEFAANSDQVRDFVARYLADAARGALAASHSGKSRGRTIKGTDYAIQSRVLQLARRLAQSSISLNVVTLLDLAVVCQEDHTRSVARDILRVSSSLGSDVAALILSSFQPILSTSFDEGQDPNAFLSTRLNLVKILNALFRCEPNISSLYTGKPLYRALAYCYHTALDAVARSYSATGVRPNETGPSFKWQLGWMELKVGILDAFHGLLQQAMSVAKSSDDVQHKIIDILLAVIDDSPKKPHSAHTMWFGDVPLLVDYQHIHRLKEKLEELTDSDDAAADFLTQSLDELFNSHAPKDGDAVGALVILLRDVPHATVVPTIRVEKVDKGKGKAAVQEEVPDTDHELDLAVTQVLDILPDESPAFLKAALRDPTIGKSPETLIAALLENNLPPHLNGLRNETPQEQPEPSSVPARFERRNIFDDDEMDFTKLQFGGARSGDADTLLNDRTFIEEMKADILRRAQEQEEDSDHEERRGPLKEIDFEEDLDDELAKPSFTLAKVDGEDTGDEDASNGQDENEGADHPPTKPKEDPEDILARAYLRDQKVFQRDATTKRSKARADLRAETGMSDEQIEGWKIMLDRNPRKDQILEKYDPAFNPPSNRDQPVHQTQDNASGSWGDRGRGGQGGRGRGRGRGRGGGRGGPPQGDSSQSSRDRARKEKYKSSMRQGGHDKKLARGGGPSS